MIPVLKLIIPIEALYFKLKKNHRKAYEKRMHETLLTDRTRVNKAEDFLPREQNQLALKRATVKSRKGGNCD